ncbi:metalloregulator ArsR/SmtB family transcription factor [Pseudolysinimonas sp.]|uniref:ArsR/SmtB family transcription factor n=1 Tax=Pseudolysinimonas sp. TaxID=2680009 RepID=UPI00286C7DB9|nr:metalloregulator ArsR/SmtB family transcription factor [Pseudolysinimonas sp.]
MADIFDVLAEPTRRDILRRLLDGEASVGDLVDALGLTQPTVSKHLAQLRDAELVTVREDGRNRIYALRPAPLGTVDAWLTPFLEGAPSTEGVDDATDAGPTIFAAWAGAEAGDRVGRVAADAAHQARTAIEAAQEKIQGAQKRVVDKMPWSRDVD